MAKNFEKTMVCKFCNEQEVGLFEGKWYNVDNDNQLHYYKCKNAPHKETKKQYAPRGATKDIDKLAVNEEIKSIKDRLDSVEQAIRALVGTSGGQETLG